MRHGDGAGPCGNAGGGPRPGGPGAGRRSGRDRRRRHRRRGDRAEGPRGRRLGHRRNHRPAHEVRRASSSPTIAAGISSPICRRPPTTSGCAATGWSIREGQGDARQAAQSRPRSSRRIRAPRRSTTRPGYWFSLIKVPDKSEFPGTGPERQRHLAEREEPGRMAADDEVGRRAGRATSWAPRRRARSPQAFRDMKTARRRLAAAHRLGPGRRRHDARHQPARSAARVRDVRRLDRPDQGRRSAAGAAASAGASSATSSSREWDWADPKAYLHDEVSTDRRNPTRQRERPDLRSLELSADYLPVLDPVRNTGRRVPLTVRDPATPRDLAGDDRSRRRTGATSRSGPARTTSTTRCSTSRGASGSPPRCARATTRPSARPDRIIRRRSCIRSTAPAGSSRCTTRRRSRSRTSARASARTT